MAQIPIPLRVLNRQNWQVISDYNPNLAVRGTLMSYFSSFHALLSINSLQKNWYLAFLGPVVHKGDFYGPIPTTTISKTARNGASEGVTLAHF